MSVMSNGVAHQGKVDIDCKYNVFKDSVVTQYLGRKSASLAKKFFQAFREKRTEERECKKIRLE